MMRAWLCQLFFIILSFTPFVHFMVYTINFMITLPYHYYEYCKVAVFNGQYIGFNITSNVPLTVNELELVKNWFTASFEIERKSLLVKGSIQPSSIEAKVKLKEKP
jgi:hypothetical protein